MADVLNYDSNCLFCKIITGEIPSAKVYEDNFCYAFRDINPQAPTHILMVPKVHIASAADISEVNDALVGHMFTKLAEIARQEGLGNGFRVVTNAGADGGQTTLSGEMG